MTAGTTIGTIVVLEDDPGVGVLQKRRLERCGHTVHLLTRPETVFDFLSKHRTDLVVLDYKLSSTLTGVDVYREMLSRELIVPAILVTGFGDERLLIDALRLGIREFIPKTRDYLEDLPGAVERVLRQIHLERKVLESDALREKDEQLRLAFEAAKLGRWSWDVERDEVSGDGIIREFCVPQFSELPISMPRFVELIPAEDRTAVQDELRSALEDKRPFDFSFRLTCGAENIRWVRLKGAPAAGARLVGIASDVTAEKEAQLELERSNRQVQSLNERLKWGMTESHHRVKNSLQIISSLLSIEQRSKNFVSGEDLKRILGHVQGFAALHDILAVQVRQDGEFTGVCAATMLERLLEILRASSSSRTIHATLEPCLVNPRQGSSLAVVCNELVCNALKYGEGEIFVELRRTDKGGQLTITNGFTAGAKSSDGSESGMGMGLLKQICEADLGARLQVDQNDNKFVARLPFLTEAGFPA